MINQISLTARKVDPIHFVFIPETWAKALKPYSKAKWTHTQADRRLPKEEYTLQHGDFLVFPQFNMTKGGFFAAHLGLTLVTIGGPVKSRIVLKPRGMSRNSTAHHVILTY